MKFFETSSRGIRSVFCGSSFSLAINDIGVLYLFGQNKKTGEANMYPKPVQDLSGWHITSVGCSNTSIVISADDTVIAWGASPTFGELVSWARVKYSGCPFQHGVEFSYQHLFRCFAGLGWFAKVQYNTKRGDAHGGNENSTGGHGYGSLNVAGKHRRRGNPRKICQTTRIRVRIDSSHYRDELHHRVDWRHSIPSRQCYSIDLLH